MRSVKVRDQADRRTYLSLKGMVRRVIIDLASVHHPLIIEQFRNDQLTRNSGDDHIQTVQENFVSRYNSVIKMMNKIYKSDCFEACLVLSGIF
jgi:hypothetical protein